MAGTFRGVIAWLSEATKWMLLSCAVSLLQLDDIRNFRSLSIIPFAII